MRKDAAAVMAEGEFNRFYIRALCIRAIDEGRELEIYRARPSAKPDEASEAKIGDKPDPKALLADLRTSPGVGTALGLPRPGSGVSVRLPLAGNRLAERGAHPGTPRPPDEVRQGDLVGLAGEGAWTSPAGQRLVPGST